MSNVKKHKSMVCDGFFGCCGFQFKPRGRAGWKFQFVAQSALAHWWFVGWQVEAVKVGQEQFNKLPFLTASHVKCSRCVSCILKNLMLNLFFCYVNYQLSEFSFGFPPILWSSFRPKYFEDFFFSKFSSWHMTIYVVPNPWYKDYLCLYQNHMGYINNTVFGTLCKKLFS